MGLSPGWMWLMLFVPTGIALGAVGLEFLEKLLVTGDAHDEHRRAMAMTPAPIPVTVDRGCPS